MSAHTPGPWRLNDARDHTTALLTGEYRCIGGGCGFHVDGHVGFSLPGHISEADARLIVAAPDLLAMLRRATESGHGDYSWHEESKALIAKTDGES